MLLLAAERAVLGAWISSLRAGLQELESTMPCIATEGNHLYDWAQAVREKANGLEQAISGGATTDLPSWYSGQLLANPEAARTLLTEDRARALVDYFREVERQHAEAMSALGQPRALTRKFAMMTGRLIGDLITLESAIYSLFPHLELDEGAP